MLNSAIMLFAFPALIGAVIPFFMGFIKRRELHGRFTKYYCGVFIIWFALIVIPVCWTNLQNFVTNRCIEFHLRTNLECSEWELVLANIPSEAGAIVWLMSFYLITPIVYRRVTNQ